MPSPFVQAFDDNHATIHGALPPSSSVDLAFDGEAHTDPFAAGCRLIRIVSTQAARVAIGLDATATATSTLIPANLPEFFSVRDGWRISALKQASAGTLNVTYYGI